MCASGLCRLETYLWRCGDFGRHGDSVSERDTVAALADSRRRDLKGQRHGSARRGSHLSERRVSRCVGIHRAHAGVEGGRGSRVNWSRPAHRRTSGDGGMRSHRQEARGTAWIPCCCCCLHDDLMRDCRGGRSFCGFPESWTVGRARTHARRSRILQRHPFNHGSPKWFKPVHWRLQATVLQESGLARAEWI